MLWHRPNDQATVHEAQQTVSRCTLVPISSSMHVHHLVYSIQRKLYNIQHLPAGIKQLPISNRSEFPIDSIASSQSCCSYWDLLQQAQSFATSPTWEAVFRCQQETVARTAQRTALCMLQAATRDKQALRLQASK
jgi:predicted transcriptional regulator of viral defense system